MAALQRRHSSSTHNGLDKTAIFVCVKRKVKKKKRLLQMPEVTNYSWANAERSLTLRCTEPQDNFFVASGLIPRLVPMIHLIYSPVHSGSDLTFFFKTPAGTDRHLLNCAYNSWKPSQRFPACRIFLAPNPPSPPSLIHQWPPPSPALPPRSIF